MPRYLVERTFPTGLEIPTDDEGRGQLASSVASALGQIVVLKGGRTVVSAQRG